MESNQEHTITLSPAQLRRLKVLADFTEEQLADFIGLVEYERVKPHRIIVKMHDPGDSMYLLLDGEVRVSQAADQREGVLAMLETGDFFGEMCLVEDGRRSANVVATRECQLLKITRAAFANVVETRPDIAARFLLAVLRVVSGRIRTMDKKFMDSILFSRYWTSASAPPARS